MEPDEVLCEVLLPLVGRRTTAVFLKPEASLKDDSTLSLACTARTTADGQIKHVNLMVGGLTSFVPLTLTATALCAGDGPATAHVFADLGELLSPSAVGGRTEYRRTLALSLVAQAETILRGTEPMEGEPPRPAQQSVKPGSWRFPQDDGAPSPVGQPLSKLDSSGVTTGEAEFVDDIPSPAGCLHLAYVLSREPRATIRAAAGTDVNGGAVAAAANELAARLAPFREALATTTHEPSMAEVAQAAHAASVSLSAGGHRTGIDKGRFEWLEGNDVRGWECNYFSWGGSGTVVEIDCRTGDAQVLTAEIVLE